MTETQITLTTDVGEGSTQEPDTVEKSIKNKADNKAASTYSQPDDGSLERVSLGKKRRSSVGKHDVVDNKEPKKEDKDPSSNPNRAHNGKRRRPRRRQRHRHRGGKPYDKLTWAERKAFEERETARALRVREERFANGHPVAPYNTTQFLMEDHIDWSGQPKLSPALFHKKHRSHRERHNSAPGGNGARSPGCVNADCQDPQCSGGGTTDDATEEGGLSETANSTDYDFDDDEDMDYAFLAKEEAEFSQTYDTIHAEGLHNMTKNQLVLEYIELEAKLEEMTKKLQRDDSYWPDGPTGQAEPNNGPTFNYNRTPQCSKCCGNEHSDEMSRLREKVELLERENKNMREEIDELKRSRDPTETVSNESKLVDDGGGEL